MFTLACCEPNAEVAQPGTARAWKAREGFPLGSSNLPLGVNLLETRPRHSPISKEGIGHILAPAQSAHAGILLYWIDSFCPVP